MTRQFWGVVLTAVGVMALLQMMNVYQFGLAFWPVVLVLVGIGVLWNSFRRLNWFGLAVGLWAGGIGLFEILANAGVNTGGITGGEILRHGWPLLLVAAGVSMVFGRSAFRFRVDFDHGGGSKIVGDMRYGQTEWVLDKDLKIDQGIGDVKVDLTTAQITEGVHRISVHAGIGDMVIRVPDDVNVNASGKLGIGDLEVLGDHRSGIGCSAHKVISVPDSPITLEIFAEMGLGDLNIIRRPASTIRVIK